MTAKEKAKLLIQKYKGFSSNSCFGEDSDIVTAKQCAEICIDEQINLLEFVYGSQKHMWTSHENETYKYWQEVKRHIKEC